ncbi:galactose-1-phosphate uridylyltransferase [Saccharothrix violaceirubra]
MPPAPDLRELPPVRVESEIRRDPLTGQWVAIAAHRQARTYRPPADLCPLCPSRPGSATEVPTSYDVVVFENRFPTFAPDVPGEVSPSRAPGRGRCEVVCFTPEHDGSFARLGPVRVRTVMEAWADRTSALGALPDVAQVFPFENRGAEIGVTLSHPHGQIYAYPFVTPRTEQMLSVAEDHLASTGRPLMGDVLAVERNGPRVIAESPYWTAFVPVAARWPVEVHVVPRRHVPDLPALSAEERADFAELYPAVLRRLDALYDKPLPYIAAWHQAPVRVGHDALWLFLEVFSVRRAADKLKYLAGSESGMGVWINDATPEDVARRLREVHN